MDHLLGGKLGLTDFIFVHLKGKDTFRNDLIGITQPLYLLGQEKELHVLKSEDALGLTITDNGAGYAFVKRIKQSSVASSYHDLRVGDHIASIDETNVIGCRHYEVAKILKQKTKGSSIRLGLFEPIKLGFGKILCGTFRSKITQPLF